MAKHIAKEIYEMAYAELIRDSDDLKGKMCDRINSKYADVRKDIKNWILSYENNNFFGRDTEVVLTQIYADQNRRGVFVTFPFPENIRNISNHKIYSKFESKRKKSTFEKNPHIIKLENGRYLECLDKDVNLFIDEVLIPLDLKWGITANRDLIISWSHWLNE